jgi:hypothetical protein
MFLRCSKAIFCAGYDVDFQYLGRKEAQRHIVSFRFKYCNAPPAPNIESCVHKPV